MENLNKGIETAAVCILGGYCMYITKGQTGIGWAVLGLFILWGL